jgi:hypothetical protein
MLRIASGRPGLRRLLVSYFLAASLRCQASSVAGVMGKTSAQRSRGISRVSAVNHTRSAGSYRIRPACRRSTAFSCRSTSSSASLARSLRNTRTARAATRRTIRQMILSAARPANHHRLPAADDYADQPRNRVFERPVPGLLVVIIVPFAELDSEAPEQALRASALPRLAAPPGTPGCRGHTAGDITVDLHRVSRCLRRLRPQAGRAARGSSGRPAPRAGTPRGAGRCRVVAARYDRTPRSGLRRSQLRGPVEATARTAQPAVRQACQEAGAPAAASALRGAAGEPGDLGAGRGYQFRVRVRVAGQPPAAVRRLGEQHPGPAGQ